MIVRLHRGAIVLLGDGDVSVGVSFVRKSGEHARGMPGMPGVDGEWGVVFSPIAPGAVGRRVPTREFVENRCPGGSVALLVSSFASCDVLLEALAHVRARLAAEEEGGDGGDPS